MVIVMGQAFPLRDENGDEIVPEGGASGRRAAAGNAPISSGKTRKSALTNRKSDAGSQFLPDVIEEEFGTGGLESPDPVSGFGAGWSRGTSAANPTRNNNNAAPASAATVGKRKREDDFVSVVMKCHEGIRSNSPFDVFPKQLVIQGHESLFVQVS